MKLERLPRTAQRGPWLLPVLLLAACGGGSDSGDTAAAATGDPVTTYFSYRRINTATEPPFSNLPEFSSIQRGDKDFSRQFDVVANIFDGSHGGIALDYFGTMYAADIDADFQDNKTGVSINWSQRLRSDASETATFNLGYDRRIRGFFTGFSQPRNVALAHAAGLLMVSDSGSADIKVFGTAATGNVPPLFTAAPPAPPWDLAYDDAADRLFASLTDGTIAVFDDFATARPAAADRVIVPTVDGSSQATTSLRGIALVPGSMGDRLVFTDVGALGAEVDGLVCAIEGAIAADGLTGTTILPANRSTLRDPVDVVATADGRLRVADARTNSLLILAATRSTIRFPQVPWSSSAGRSTGPPRWPSSPSSPSARSGRWATWRTPRRPSRVSWWPRTPRAPTACCSCSTSASRCRPSARSTSARPSAASRSTPWRRLRLHLAERHRQHRRGQPLRDPARHGRRRLLRRLTRSAAADLPGHLHPRAVPRGSDRRRCRRDARPRHRQ